MITWQLLPLFLGGTLSAILVVVSSNPVHAILALVLLFTNSAACLLAIGSSFLGLIIIVIYMGAVSVLFLFTLMMLNIEETSQTKERKKLRQSITLTWVLSFMAFSTFNVIKRHGSTVNAETSALDWRSSQLFQQANLIELVDQMGYNLYSSNKEVLIVASLILLVALIAAIMLSLSHQRKILRQKLQHQSLMEASSSWIS